MQSSILHITTRRARDMHNNTVSVTIQPTLQPNPHRSQSLYSATLLLLHATAPTTPISKIYTHTRFTARAPSRRLAERQVLADALEQVVEAFLGLGPGLAHPDERRRGHGEEVAEHGPAGHLAERLRVHAAEREREAALVRERRVRDEHPALARAHLHKLRARHGHHLHFAPPEQPVARRVRAPHLVLAHQLEHLTRDVQPAPLVHLLQLAHDRRVVRRQLVPVHYRPLEAEPDQQLPRPAQVGHVPRRRKVGQQHRHAQPRHDVRPVDHRHGERRRQLCEVVRQARQRRERKRKRPGKLWVVAHDHRQYGGGRPTERMTRRHQLETRVLAKCLEHGLPYLVKQVPRAPQHARMAKALHHVIFTPLFQSPNTNRVLRCREVCERVYQISRPPDTDYHSLNLPVNGDVVGRKEAGIRGPCGVQVLTRNTSAPANDGPVRDARQDNMRRGGHANRKAVHAFGVA
ncbi:unnamed protein product [Chondrus crispus]|uniref:Uncharacterized protein n=1 Tax=Chondrus crispus TaxID=2769 RepID=R7QP38_CHOCR|nr:unnamed protein product [Chondrus crispus]CDF39251.1 unnamed protein product [Chondrus crispus]|eukprot:XP_005719162.1 unnamed protein product [Chondrus crispus]